MSTQRCWDLDDIALLDVAFLYGSHELSLSDICNLLDAHEGGSDIFELDITLPLAGLHYYNLAFEYNS